MIPFKHSPMVGTAPAGVDTTISNPKSSIGTNHIKNRIRDEHIRTTKIK